MARDRRIRSRAALWNTAAAALAAQWVSSKAATESPLRSRVIFWETSNSTPAALSEQFDGLYDSLNAMLANGVTIPTQTIANINSRTHLELLREYGQYRGSSVVAQQSNCYAL